MGEDINAERLDGVLTEVDKSTHRRLGNVAVIGCGCLGDLPDAGSPLPPDARLLTPHDEGVPVFEDDSLVCDSED